MVLSVLPGGPATSCFKSQIMSYRKIQIQKIKPSETDWKNAVAKLWMKEEQESRDVPRWFSDSVEKDDMLSQFHESYFGRFGVDDVEGIEDFDTSDLNYGDPYYLNDMDDFLYQKNIRSNTAYRCAFFDEPANQNLWEDRVYLGAIEEMLKQMKAKIEMYGK